MLPRARCFLIPSPPHPLSPSEVIMRPYDYSTHISNMLASGGYVSRGRGGYSAHYEDISERRTGEGYTSRSYSNLSGCCSALWDQAVAAGVPCRDTTTIPDDRICDTIGFPVPVIDTFDRLEHRAIDADWSGAGSMSYCDARLYAVLAWTLGATLAGQPLPSEEEQRKAAGWFAAQAVRRAEYAIRREEEDLRVRALMEDERTDEQDEQLEALRASVLDQDDPDGLAQLYPTR